MFDGSHIESHRGLQTRGRAGGHAVHAENALGGGNAPILGDIGRDIRQPQPREVGRDPDPARQPHAHVNCSLPKYSRRRLPRHQPRRPLRTGPDSFAGICPNSSRNSARSRIAVLELQTHLGIALGLFLPVFTHFHLQEQIQRMFVSA